MTYKVYQIKDMIVKLNWILDYINGEENTDKVPLNSIVTDIEDFDEFCTTTYEYIALLKDILKSSINNASVVL